MARKAARMPGTNDVRGLADMASQVLGIRRAQAERLAERYAALAPGHDRQRFLRWIIRRGPS